MSGENQVNSVGSGNINIGRDYIAGDKVMGDKISGNKVIGDKNTITGNAFTQNNNANTNEVLNTQDLAQAAQDIKALIDQLSTYYDTTTPSGKRKLTYRILETLEGNTTIQNRVLKALTGAGKVALEEAIDHPIAKVLVAGLEGYLE
jgi:internalin A